MATPMRRFGGFPDGKLRYIEVPDLFFTGLASVVDNLSELKVLLHLIWLRQRRGKQAVTRRELETDETLLRSLAVGEGDAAVELTEGLAQAVTRGALVHLRLETDEEGSELVYALNSEAGRHALAALAAGDVQLEPLRREEPEAGPRANIFELYEANIGLLSPILADELREAENTYPAEWIEEAFRAAVASNVRKWRYVRAILERWATEGKDDGINQRDSGKGRRWYTEEEFEQFFEH
jgi:DNA replication protein